MESALDQKYKETIATIKTQLERLRNEGLKGLVTLFVPTRDLQKLLELRSLDNCQINYMDLTFSSPIKGSREKIETGIMGFYLYRTKDNPRLIGSASLHKPEKATLKEVVGICEAYHLRNNIRKLIVTIHEKELVFKAKIPPKESLLKSASAKTPFLPHTGGVLDLQKDHDLYSLLKVKEMIPNSKLRVCQILPKTVKEGLCLSII